MLVAPLALPVVQEEILGVPGGVKNDDAASLLVLDGYGIFKSVALHRRL
jgi:hypothetical protein